MYKIGKLTQPWGALVFVTTGKEKRMIPLDDIWVDIHLFQLSEQGVRLDKVECFKIKWTTVLTASSVPLPCL